MNAWHCAPIRQHQERRITVADKVEEGGLRFVMEEKSSFKLVNNDFITMPD